MPEDCVRQLALSRMSAAGRFAVPGELQVNGGAQTG